MSDVTLDDLATVRQLAEEYPSLFTEPSLRWKIHNGGRTGFDRCVYRFGNRVYIHKRRLAQFIASEGGDGPAEQCYGTVEDRPQHCSAGPSTAKAKTVMLPASGAVFCTPKLCLGEMSDLIRTVVLACVLRHTAARLLRVGGATQQRRSARGWCSATKLRAHPQRFRFGITVRN